MTSSQPRSHLDRSVIFSALAILLASVIEVRIGTLGYKISPASLALALTGPLLCWTSRLQFNRAFFQQRPYIAVFTMWIVWMAISTAASGHVALALKAWGKYACQYLLFIGLIAHLSKRDRSSEILTAIYAFGVLMALIGIVEYVSPTPIASLVNLVRSPLPSTWPRIAGLLQNPNPFGAMMVLALSAAVALSAMPIITRSLWLSAPLFCMAAILSGSRNASLIMVAAIIPGFLRFRLTRVTALFAAVFVLGFLVWKSPTLGPRTLPFFRMPVATAFPEMFNIRLDLWKGAIAAVQTRPFLGLGPGVYQATFSAYTGSRVPLQYEGALNSHNLFTESLVSSGWTGAWLFSVSIISMLMGAWASTKRGAFFLATIPIALQQLDNFLTYSFPLMMCCWTILACSLTSYPKEYLKLHTPPTRKHGPKAKPSTQ